MAPRLEGNHEKREKHENHEQAEPILNGRRKPAPSIS
jgi:hypothetical protein